MQRYEQRRPQDAYECIALNLTRIMICVVWLLSTVSIFLSCLLGHDGSLRLAIAIVPCCVVNDIAMVRPRLVQEGESRDSRLRDSNNTESTASHQQVLDQLLAEELSRNPNAHFFGVDRSDVSREPKNEETRRSVATSNTFTTGGSSSLAQACGDHFQMSSKLRRERRTHDAQFTIGESSHGSHSQTPGMQDVESMEEESFPSHDSGATHVPLSQHTNPDPHFHTNIPHETTRQQQQYPAAVTRHRTNYEIGADERPTERMQGVEDHSIKHPLVVLDGANVAYAYATALQGSSLIAESTRLHPDARGIRVACRYWTPHNRVLVVLPSSWFRKKPTGAAGSGGFMITDHLEAIEQLQETGLLVSAPPTDDDDAYALTIAQRENARARQRGHGPAFVVSNDLFRDAQVRDASGQLREWLTKGTSEETGMGRISYTFADMGNLDDYGERELDFVPNPRHPLVQWVDSQTHSTT